MRWYYFCLPAIVVIAVLSYAYFASGTAIVDATILRKTINGGQFQLILNASQAFPNFPLFTMSNCDHNIGEHLAVGVKITSWFGGYKPIYDEAQLFKQQGIGYVPWNGCS